MKNVSIKLINQRYTIYITGAVNEKHAPSPLAATANTHYPDNYPDNQYGGWKLPCKV